MPVVRTTSWSEPDFRYFPPPSLRLEVGDTVRWTCRYRNATDHPVHFGVMMILNLILGTIHPPIGVVLFVTSRIAGISFEKMSRAILPWLVPLLIVLAAVTLWPSLTLWLPNLVFGK